MGILISPYSSLSNVKICNVPWTYDYQNVVHFGTTSALKTYIDGLTGVTYSDVRPVRNNVIDVPLNVDTTYKYNYLRYQNANFENKNFYCFIVGRDPINDNITRLTLEIDVWQTYFYDASWKNSFIHRQIIPKSSDLKGTNLLAEGLDYGDEYWNSDYEILDKAGTQNNIFTGWAPVTWCANMPQSTQSGSWYYDNASGKYFGFYLVFDIQEGDILPWGSSSPADDEWFFIQLKQSDSASGSNATVYSTFYCKEGTRSGLGANGMHCMVFKNANNERSSLRTFEIALQVYNLQAENAIQSIQLLPQEFLYQIDRASIQYWGTNKICNQSDLFGGYTPKNNKLYQYPYVGVNIDTMTNGTQDYRFEDWATGSNWGTATWTVKVCASPNASAVIYPSNSSGWSFDLSRKLEMQAFPEVSWVTDYYSSWLAQQGGMNYLTSTYDRSQNTFKAQKVKNIAQTATNAVNDVSNMISDVTDAASNFFFTGSESAFVAPVLSGVANTANDVVQGVQNDKIISNNAEQNTADYLKQFQVARIGGNQYGVGSVTGLGYMDLFGPFVSVFSIKYEYAKRIDDYFTKYGYTVDKQAVPTFNNRSNWDYIQTAGATCTGDIPNAERVALQNILDNGTTIWHNVSTMYDYSQTNS